MKWRLLISFLRSFSSLSLSLSLYYFTLFFALPSLRHTMPSCHHCVATARTFEILFVDSFVNESEVSSTDCESHHETRETDAHVIRAHSTDYKLSAKSSNFSVVARDIRERICWSTSFRASWSLSMRSHLWWASPVAMVAADVELQMRHLAYDFQWDSFRWIFGSKWNMSKTTFLILFMEQNVFECILRKFVLVDFVQWEHGCITASLHHCMCDLEHFEWFACLDLVIEVGFLCTCKQAQPQCHENLSSGSRWPHLSVGFWMNEFAGAREIRMENVVRRSRNVGTLHSVANTYSIGCCSFIVGFVYALTLTLYYKCDKFLSIKI